MIQAANVPDVDRERRLWQARRDLRSDDARKRERALQLIDHLAREETRQCWTPGLGRSPVIGGLPGGVRRFASFFTGVIHELQPNLGVVYDSTLTGAGTSPPAITLSGSLVGAPVPILVTCTTGGARGTWVGAVSYDEGATTAQIFTSAATVPLTGAGSGVTLNIVTGTASTNNTWVAVANQLTDLSSSAAHCTQSTQARKPAISKGLNGRIGVKSDGVDDVMVYTLALPAPLTTATFFWGVWRLVTTPSLTNIVVTSDSNGTGLLSYLVLVGSAASYMHNATTGLGIATAVNTWYRVEQAYTGSVSDYNRAGSLFLSAASTGNNTPASSRGLFALPANTNFGAFELLCHLTLNNVPTPAQLGNASAAVTSEYAGLVAV